MKSQLLELGLTENEATTYLFLLKNPNTTTGTIIKHTNISNSQVYIALNKLITKGLVEYQVLNNGKHFSASSPNSLYEVEKERNKLLKELVPKLKSIQIEKVNTTKTAVYEGINGFKTAFNKIIDDCPEKETIRILGFSEQEKQTDSLRLFLKNANLRSIEKKQKLKIILDEQSRNSVGKDREKEPYTEVKYLPHEYINPCAIDTFEDYTYILLWDKTPHVFMIKNEKIANSFKNHFEALWKLSK
ncbi:MAG: TrmB family transcriptional regulator [Candidatus Woesearchaeota archaeon]